MAEQEPTQEQLAELAASVDAADTPDTPLNYKPPAQKTLQEIQELDQDDESLRKYKETLLGSAVANVDPSIPNVQVIQMTLLCESAPQPLVLNLTGDLEGFKKTPFTLKEGVDYKIQVTFKVNREIVSGLKYLQTLFRKNIKVDKSEYMVGSYGPRPNEAYQYLTTVEEAPKGMMARGTYVVKSKFTDDDKNDHLSWEWSLAIKKDWKD